LYGAKEIPAKDVVDHPQHRLPPLQQTNRDGSKGIAMGKVGGAIEGIDHPGVGALRGSLLAGFFRQDHIFGEVPP